MNSLHAALVMLACLGHCYAVATVRDGEAISAAAQEGLGKMPPDAKMRMYDFLGPNKFLSAAVSQQNRADYLKYSNDKTTTLISEAVSSPSVADHQMNNGIDRLTLFKWAIMSDNVVVAKHLLVPDKDILNRQIATKTDDPCVDAKSLSMVQFLYINGFCYDAKIIELAAKRSDVQSLNWFANNDKTSKMINFKRIAELAFKEHIEAVIDWVMENTPETGISRDIANFGCSYAAAFGRIDVLEWIYLKKGSCPKDAYGVAIESGKFEVLNWLRAKNVRVSTGNVCHAALKKGSFEALEWIYSLLLNCNRQIYMMSVHYQHLDVVDWALQINIPIQLSENSCKWASTVGAIDALMWFRQRDLNCNYATFVHAIAAGQVEFLNWVEATYPGNPGLFSQSDTSSAAALGYLKTLMWVDNRLTGPDWDVTEKQRWYKELVHVAAVNLQLEVLEWAYAKIDPRDEDLVTYVAGLASQAIRDPGINPMLKRCDEMFMWAFKNHATLDEDIMLNMAENDRHEIWKWSIDTEPTRLVKYRRKQLKLSDVSCIVAARKGRHDILLHVLSKPELKEGCLGNSN